MNMKMDGIVTNIEKKLQARSLNINIVGGELKGYGYYISDINTVVYNKNLIGKDEKANYDYLNDLLNSLHKYIIKYSPIP